MMHAFPINIPIVNASKILLYTPTLCNCDVTAMHSSSAPITCSITTGSAWENFALCCFVITNITLHVYPHRANHNLLMYLHNEHIPSVYGNHARAVSRPSSSRCQYCKWSVLRRRGWLARLPPVMLASRVGSIVAHRSMQSRHMPRMFSQTWICFSHHFPTDCLQSWEQHGCWPHHTFSCSSVRYFLDTRLH